MVTYLLGLYLKFNLLLAVALLLWLTVREIARYCRFQVSHQDQLLIARFLFGAFMLALPAVWLLNAVLPGLLAAAFDLVPAAVYAGEMAVGADIDNGLNWRLALGDSGVLLASLLLVLMAGGLLLQGARLFRQWLQLRALVAESLPWRSIHGIHILFSERVGTPFSTRALGRRHIVLPSRLLESPVNLRLALRHELQHLRNGDLGWVLFIEVVRLLCFWNPAAHAWQNEFDCLQEFACDEVLVQRRRVDFRAYGRCLLEVATAGPGIALPASSNMVPRFSLWRSGPSQLKRRIMMLDRKRNENFKLGKRALYALLFGAGLVNSSLLVFAQQEPPQARQEYLPIVTIQPQYPSRALQMGITGWAQIEFTVTEQGGVKDPIVEDHCADGRGLDGTDDGRGCVLEYSDIFDAAALRAIARFKFSPRYNEAGEPVQTSGVRYVFTFRLTQD